MSAKYAINSGKLICPDSFSIVDVDISDIAHHLSKCQRFGGALPINVTYSVAEHSINLANWALSLRIYGEEGGVKYKEILAAQLLMHDASEAYLGDIPSPLKVHLKDYIKIEKRFQKIIESRFPTCAIRSSDKGMIKMADKRILMDEVKAIMPSKLDIYREETGTHPLNCAIQFNNDPRLVKAVFLSLAKRLKIIQ